MPSRAQSMREEAMPRAHSPEEDRAKNMREEDVLPRVHRPFRPVFRT